MPSVDATPTVPDQLNNDQSQTLSPSNGVKGANGEPNSASPVIQAILARRAKAGKLVAGVAAASDSDMFKGPVSRSLERRLLLLHET